MATLDVTGVSVLMFPVDTTITTSDGAGGTETFIALAQERWGVPYGQTSMTVTPAGKAVCMTEGAAIGQGNTDRSHLGVGVAAQVMTGNEVRTSA